MSTRKQVTVFNPPPQEVLDQLPRLYANEKTQTPIKGIIIHLHFFVAGCDWWIAEYDGDDLFWGFCNLNDDQCAEWGYVSFEELKSIGSTGQLPVMVDYDEYWKSKPFREVQWRRREG